MKDDVNLRKNCLNVSCVIFRLSENVVLNCMDGRKHKAKKCPICDYQCFGKNYHLKKHLLVHSSIKYKCEFCKMKYYQLTKLNDHLNTCKMANWWREKMLFTILTNVIITQSGVPHWKFTKGLIWKKRNCRTHLS